MTQHAGLRSNTVLQLSSHLMKITRNAIKMSQKIFAFYHESPRSIVRWIQQPTLPLWLLKEYKQQQVWWAEIETKEIMVQINKWAWVMNWGTSHTQNDWQDNNTISTIQQHNQEWKRQIFSRYNVGRLIRYRVSLRHPLRRSFWTLFCTVHVGIVGFLSIIVQYYSGYTETGQ